jgi:hypothetical protein
MLLPRLAALVLLSILLASCGVFAKRTPTMRTTTYGTGSGAVGGAFGAPLGATVVDKPFDPFAEGAAAAGAAMFSRPLAP